MQKACQKMLDLSNKCMHPKTNKPYVKSHGGGRDNSPEGHQVVIAPIFRRETRCTVAHADHPSGRLYTWICLRVRKRRGQGILPYERQGAPRICQPHRGLGTKHPRCGFRARCFMRVVGHRIDDRMYNCNRHCLYTTSYATFRRP